MSQTTAKDASEMVESAEIIAPHLEEHALNKEMRQEEAKWRRRIVRRQVMRLRILFFTVGVFCALVPIFIDDTVVFDKSYVTAISLLVSGFCLTAAATSGKRS